LNIQRLKNIVEDSDSKSGRVFDVSIQCLIVISLITFSIETLPSFRWWLYAIEVVTVAIFTIEYILRLTLADRKREFAFSFFGIIDLLSILPFYISTGVDLRSIRAFRLLRLFRAFKLVRYSKAIQRFHRALLIAREELILYFIVTVMLGYLAAVGIYYCETDAQPEKFTSVFHSLWWAVATLTTVGYGDVYPITAGGKIFTFLMLLVGLGIVSVPAGIVSSALQAARELEDDLPNDAA
jgi:voltage-gated potassium channel